jgi:hypothetical protein
MECDVNDYFCINEHFQQPRHSVLKLISLHWKIQYTEHSCSIGQGEPVSVVGRWEISPAESSQETIDSKLIYRYT